MEPRPGDLEDGLLLPRLSQPANHLACRDDLAELAAFCRDDSVSVGPQLRV